MTLTSKMLATLLWLAPLPCLAQEPAAGWTADPRTGCRVVNAHPQPNETISWSGGCAGGLAEGRGVLQWFANGRPTEHYDGDMHEGMMDGQGDLMTGNGGRYVGAFHAGKANGTGEWITVRGRFSGVWKNGCFNDGNRRGWVGADPASCP